MLVTPRRDNLNKIVILNPKGGCGKSTLATNLAASYAARSTTPAIMDYDPQGSTMGWLERRPEDLPEIHGIAAYKRSMQATRSWQLRVPNDTVNLIVDSPASVTHDDLRELTRDSTSILVPVLPSPMDMRAATPFIKLLLDNGRVARKETRVALIANRCRENYNIYHQLDTYLRKVRKAPFISVLRETQNYVRAAERGLGIFELAPYAVRRDIDQWDPIVRWLNSKRSYSA